MPAINYETMKGESGRNFDAVTLNENYNVAMQDGTGRYGALRFFKGIRDFFKGIQALGSLAATSRIPVTDANGNVSYATMNDVNNYVINNALTDLTKLNTIPKTDTNECILEGKGQGNFYVQNGGSNLPNNTVTHWYIVTVAQDRNAQKQIAYSTHFDEVYIRKYLSYQFGNWEKLTTETDLNNALSNIYKTSKQSLGTLSFSSNTLQKTLSFTANNVLAVSLAFNGVSSSYNSHLVLGGFSFANNTITMDFWSNSTTERYNNVTVLITYN